jgi:hypothetical protein
MEEKHALLKQAVNKTIRLTGNIQMFRGTVTSSAMKFCSQQHTNSTEAIGIRKEFALTIYCKSQKAELAVTDIRNVLLPVPQ